jgi:hypothetical protein
MAGALETCLCCEVRLFALFALSILPSIAHGQDAPPPGRAVEEQPTTEEAQRAQLAAGSQATAAPLTTTTTTGGDTAETEEEEGGDVIDCDPADDDCHLHDHDAALSAAVFPPPPPLPPSDPDPELEEELVLPPPEPQWRLRLGLGATAATAGGPVVSFRMIQELEWMPPETAPILFSLTGGEVLGEYIMGLGGARVGLYGIFCQDRIVTCTGAIAVRAGVVGGTPGVTFDVGGDGDARFRFDGVELAIRLGFFVIQGVTFVDAVGMVGAAF